MTLYLGIDIGTFESKGVLVDGRGTILARSARPHKMLVPEPGFAEHRAEEDWWGDFCFLSRDLIARSGADPKSIRAIATSAIGPCMLPVDKAGDPLMNGVLYNVDSRSRQEIIDLTAELGEDRIFDICGNILTAQSVGPKILWLKRNRPEIYAAAAEILTSTSFIVRRLTGQSVIDHYSASSWTPLYDVEKRQWSAELCAGIVDIDQLPRLAWTTDIVGHVTPAASHATGLAVGTPVTAGTIDAAAEALSVGVLGNGDMMLMYGSSIFTIAITDRRLRDPRIWYAPWLFPEQHVVMGGHATSGTITHWFRDQIGRDLDPTTAMPTLAAEAASSPAGANGLVFLPYFAGATTPLYDPKARGVLFGLNLTHSRADMMRGVLEGIAFATRHIVDSFTGAGASIADILAVGGGTNNAVWTAAVSDALGRPQTLRQISAGAAYGNAFLAALAIGDVTRPDIRTWNPVASTIPTNTANAEIYERNYRIFRDLYPATKELMHRLG